MKTPFVHDIPRQFDCVLAENRSEVDFIANAFDKANRFSLEEISEMSAATGGPTLNVDNADVPTKEEEFFIRTSQIFAQTMAANFFEKEIERKLPVENFVFFDESIYKDYKLRKAKGFYSIFSGSVFIRRQSNKLLSCLQIFKQIWNSMGYSWVAWDGESFFFTMNGLAFNYSDKVMFYWTNNALSSMATELFYSRFATRLPCFGKDKNLRPSRVIGNIYSVNDQIVIDNVFHGSRLTCPVCAKSGAVLDFSKTKLDGDFFRIRPYCRNAYGRKGLKKLGLATAIS